MDSPRQKRVVAAVVLTTLASTALFLAQGTTGLLASAFIPLDRDVEATPVGRPAKAAGRQDRDDTTILSRNIFDSETGSLVNPPGSDEPEEEVEEVAEPFDPDAPPPYCDGAVRLVGAIVNPRNPDWSFAAIVGAAGKALLYRPGMNVEGRQLVAVGSQRVIMQPSGGQYCQLAMFAPEQPAATPGRTAAARRDDDQEEEEEPRRRRQSREGAISSADMEAGITRNSDTSFTVQRQLVDQILENQAELMRTARIIPHEENGRVVGVKMYGIRRNSLLGRLGMQNGDMLRTINGFDMSSPDSALEAYARLRNVDHLTLSVVRRGQATTIDYQIQ